MDRGSRAASGLTEFLRGLVGHRGHVDLGVSDRDVHQCTSLMVSRNDRIDQMAHQESLTSTTGTGEDNFLLVIVQQETEKGVRTVLLSLVQFGHGVLQKEESPFRGILDLLDVRGEVGWSVVRTLGDLAASLEDWFAINELGEVRSVHLV